MNTAVTWEINSTSLDDTLEIGAKLGQKLKGGEVIELIGDVGSGKTAFVRGIAAGLESPDEVASPSFTISREYKGHNGLELHHFDFYRLLEPGVIAAELSESINDTKVVVAVEWSDIVDTVLPHDRLQLKIQVKSELERKFIFSAGAGHAHLQMGTS